MIKEEIFHHTAYMGWGELREFPGPADVKILREETECGAKTMLVRVPPSGTITPHGHRGVVQHYVLEGDYETKGLIYCAGAYRMMPEHYDVSPITTEKGVTILMIYDPIS